MSTIEPSLHVWVNEPAYPWAQDNARLPLEDASCNMLLEKMARNGIETSVQARMIRHKCETRYEGDNLK